jgi:predicted NAD/FAD-binding protein
LVDRCGWFVSLALVLGDPLGHMAHQGTSLFPRRKKYVEAVLADLPKENVHVNTPIKSVSPHDNGVTLVEESGRTHEYDYVIMA